MAQLKFVEDSLKQIISLQFFLKAVFHKFYLAHSWIPGFIWKSHLERLVMIIINILIINFFKLL